MSKAAVAKKQRVEFTVRPAPTIKSAVDGVAMTIVFTCGCGQTSEVLPLEPRQYRCGCGIEVIVSKGMSDVSGA